MKPLEIVSIVLMEVNRFMSGCDGRQGTEDRKKYRSRMSVISLTKKDSWFLFLMFLLGLWRDLAEGEEGIGGDALLDELRSECFHIYIHLSRLSMSFG